jgi:hypothetical protein
LFVHCARRAASRDDWTAGKSSAMSMAIMDITTSNSIKVKPRSLRFIVDTLRLEIHPTAIAATYRFAPG